MTFQPGLPGLVLQRRIGESLVILTKSGNITVAVHAIGLAHVRLRIAAPPEVTILRSEIMEEEGDNV